MSCDGQCHGCALKPGAAANVELDNRMTAALAALGGIPFLCHDRIGWQSKGKRDGYPKGREARIQRAHANLITAPRLIHNSAELASCISDTNASGLPAEMFAADRKALGRRPMCQGWRNTVGDLAKQGWFKNKPLSKVRRIMAKTALDDLRKIKQGDKKAFGGLEEAIRWFASEIKEAGVKFTGFGRTKK